MLIDVIPKGFSPEESAFAFGTADSLRLRSGQALDSQNDSQRESFCIARNDNRREKLQFKIKGQDYFLAFVEQERRWYVFAPTTQGVHRIPVYVDAAEYEKPGILEENAGSVRS